MTKEVNFDEFKCRCSAIKKMMAEKQGFATLTPKQEEKVIAYEKELEEKGCLAEGKKKDLADLYLKRENSKTIVLSDTCTDYLMEWYSWEVEGMIAVNKEAMMELNVGVKKGKLVEPQSLQLISIVRGEIYKVHKERIYNDYLSGEIDCYIGESVYEAIEVADMKNATDHPGFLKKIHGGLENGQKEQLQGYGDITGAKILGVKNTLVDMPDILIEEMRWSVLKAVGGTTFESPEFVAEWPKWERSMKFTHIPVHKRVYTIPVEPFTEIERQKVYDKVKICREWLWKFHEMYSNMNLS